MEKLGISKKELLKEYLKEINNICDINENKSTFTGQEVCSIVISILNEKSVKTTLKAEELHKKYHKHVKKLKLSKKEWVEKYGIPEIIGIIHSILEEKA